MKMAARLLQCSRDLLLVACVLAAVVPFLNSRTKATAAIGFPGWPTTFEGKPLRALPLGAAERQFAEGFPGRLGRFSDGEREIIVRWVSTQTRRLHPASDCFRGIGYAITPAPLLVDGAGAHWGRFTAARAGQRLEVRERIFDGSGHEWTDISAWYWAAATGESSGPWWAIVIASAAGSPSFPAPANSRPAVAAAGIARH